MKELKHSKKSAKNVWEIDSEIRQSRKEDKERRSKRRNKRKEWE